jgi:hypothetical protein
VPPCHPPAAAAWGEEEGAAPVRVPQRHVLEPSSVEAPGL